MSDDTAETRPPSWSSPGDEGWRKAAEVSRLQEREPATATRGGLPKRVPGQNLIPGAAPATTQRRATPAAHGVDTRRTRGLSSFQQGVSRARSSDPADPAGDEHRSEDK